MLMNFLASIAAAVPALVTVSGETITDTDTPGPVTTGLRFTNTGYVEAFLGSTSAWNPVDSSTDWIIPHEAAGVLYSVRLTVSSGTSPTTGSVGSWETLDSTRTWTLVRPDAAGSGSTTGTYLLQVSDDGGSTVLDSASYTLTSTII